MTKAPSACDQPEGGWRGGSEPFAIQPGSHSGIVSARVATGNIAVAVTIRCHHRIAQALHLRAVVDLVDANNLPRFKIEIGAQCRIRESKRSTNLITVICYCHRYSPRADPAQLQRC